MTGYGIGFPKQSKFKEMINKEIIEMHHSGLESLVFFFKANLTIVVGEIERLRRFWFTGNQI